MTFQYQVALTGNPGKTGAQLKSALFESIDELGISRSQIAILDESTIGTVEPKAPLVAIFFGYEGASDASHPCLAALRENSNTIVPCVENLTTVSTHLPNSIRHINAFALAADGVRRLATIILENLRLLRSERRLFISYKRSESQSVAIQLYEILDKAGFDVFLDTRSVPIAADFQNVLWHRMADSDIVVLLDTPKFRESHWTMLELSQANATNIQIFHVLWPGVPPDEHSAFSAFMQLTASDFEGGDQIGIRARLTETLAETIPERIESLRARALAARHRSLVDNFCDRARDEKAISVAVQPERFISVKLARGETIAVVPTIGVPRADRCQEIETSIRGLGGDIAHIWLLFDERGILATWLTHLAWLNNHLPVKSVQVSRCADQLRGGAP